MKFYKVELKSLSPLSQNKYMGQKNPNENDNEFEKRAWRNRLHVDEEGHVFIPPTAFKAALTEAAKYLKMKVPGKGSSTYTRYISAGTLVQEPVTLSCEGEKIEGETVNGDWVFVPTDGISGGGKRVMKRFPKIPAWEGTLEIAVIDEANVTRSVLEKHLEAVGMFIGVGSFRPGKNPTGWYGRFQVQSLKEIDRGEIPPKGRNK